MKRVKPELNGKKIAIIVTHGFEEVEMTSPREALEKAGAKVVLLSPKGNKVRSWQHDKWGRYFKVNKNVKNAKPKEFDALVLPGGVMNPDKLRTDKNVIGFIKAFFKAKKPIASICHGPWTLIETGEMKGRIATSYSSIKTDLINAGVKWQNKTVVIDQKLVTSRAPKDLSAFNKAIVRVFSE